MATIKDVAKLAGVSHGTVSNILKGLRGVSLEKVKRVEDAMKELGFQPAAAARSLKTNRTMTVGVVLPNITDPCYSQIFTGVERVLSENQYATSLYITSEVPANERKVLRQIQQQRMDGIIIATCQPKNTKLFEQLTSADIKMVFIEREAHEADFSFVGFKNKFTVYDATLQLIDMGYKTVALVTGPEEYHSECQCMTGYKNALQERSREFDPMWAEITNMDKESSFKAAFRLLQREEIPDAILASTTQIAEGIYKAIHLCEDNLAKKPLVIALGQDSWTNRDSGDGFFLSRQAITLGENAAEILLENIHHAAFFESKRILLDNPKVDLCRSKQGETVQRKSAGQGKIKVLMLDSSASYATRSLLADFKRKEGIAADIDVLSYKELYDAIRKGDATGMYDVFQVDIPWLPEFVEDGILHNLSGLIEENPASIQDLIPGILDSYSKYDDKFFVLPYMYGTQILYYRKDLFEEPIYQRLFYEKYRAELKPPKTWTEFNAIAKFFTLEFNPDSPTLYGTTLGGKFSSGSVCEFLPRKWAYGGVSFDPHGNVKLNSKETIKALTNYCESFKYASPTSTEHWWGEQVEEFCQGKAAMMVLFMSHATDITDRYKSKVVGKVGYDLIPGGCPLLGGWSLGINRCSDRKEEAFKFASWACCKEMAIPYTILGGSTPCVNLYKNSELLSVYPWLPKSLESFNISRKRTMPKSVGGRVVSERQYEEILGEAVYLSITNRLQPEQAISAAAEKLQDLMIHK